jgi:hypothetical protein
MAKHSSAILAALALFLATAAQAQVVQTSGSGSAVSSVEGSASFESYLALVANPYVEGGMSFTRTNLSFDNNGCGYAGCSDAFPGFSGNYEYGTGNNGYFSMYADGGATFHGLEFILGSGYGPGNRHVSWEAYLDGSLVSSGSTMADMGTVIGFSSTSGFDELRYTDYFSNFFSAPAFDEVRADFSGTSSSVPEPASMMLFGTGLVALYGFGRKRRRKSGNSEVV